MGVVGGYEGGMESGDWGLSEGGGGRVIQVHVHVGGFCKYTLIE